ncbi:hypothetical protein [Stenotrophomonas maltophilia]|jgi:hypothetical protein|uniref:hypothetical protein n=1 Tax=Stenotrophomonas maltophilia TaxID=40324 RepID=UPI0022B79613|nr:hypothetical protein [Stenotrophomonas maltophilia]MCZ7845324.1 hypothetical protein [Stenotrophomonas maltophilia]
MSLVLLTDPAPGSMAVASAPPGSPSLAKWGAGRREEERQLLSIDEIGAISSMAAPAHDEPANDHRHLPLHLERLR